MEEGWEKTVITQKKKISLIFMPFFQLISQVVYNSLFFRNELKIGIVSFDV
jgi:hypothetical protein